MKNIKGKISRSRCTLQKNDITHLEGYQQWATHLSPKIEAHLISLIRYFPKGDNTLRELLGYFEKQKIILPSYRTLQDLFTHCFSLENNRLAEITESMPEEIKSQLDEIIKNDDGISQLNVIRIDQKNFQYTSIKLEIDKALSLEELYRFSKIFLPTLKLANNAIRYYASLAELYPVFRLRGLVEI